MNTHQLLNLKSASDRHPLPKFRIQKALINRKFEWLRKFTTSDLNQSHQFEMLESNSQTSKSVLSRKTALKSNQQHSFQIIECQANQNMLILALNNCKQPFKAVFLNECPTHKIQLQMKKDQPKASSQSLGKRIRTEEKKYLIKSGKSLRNKENQSSEKKEFEIQPWNHRIEKFEGFGESEG